MMLRIFKLTLFFLLVSSAHQESASSEVIGESGIFVYANLEYPNLAIVIFNGESKVAYTDEKVPFRRCNSTSLCIEFDELLIAIPPPGETVREKGLFAENVGRQPFNFLGRKIDSEVIAVTGGKVDQKYLYSPGLGLIGIILRNNEDKAVFLLQGEKGLWFAKEN